MSNTKEELRKEFLDDDFYPGKDELSPSESNIICDWFYSKISSLQKEVDDLREKLKAAQTLNPERVIETAKQDKLI